MNRYEQMTLENKIADLENKIKLLKKDYLNQVYRIQKISVVIKLYHELMLEEDSELAIKDLNFHLFNKKFKLDEVTNKISCINQEKLGLKIKLDELKEIKREESNDNGNIE